MRKIVLLLAMATAFIATAPQISSAASISGIAGMQAQTGLMQRAHDYGNYDDYYYPRYRHHRYSYYPRYRYYRCHDYDYDYYPRRHYYRYHYYHPYRHYYRRYWY